MKYSKLYFPWNKIYKYSKKMYKKDLTRIEFLERAIEYVSDKSKPNLFTTTEDLGYKIDYRILSNQGVIHYFVEDKKLFDFLSNTQIKDLSMVKELFNKHIGTDILIIHHPNKKLSSFKIIGIKNKGSEQLDFVSIDEKVMSDNLGGQITLKLNHKEKIDKADMYTRFIVNFLMYINTFPDSVKDGAPNTNILYGLNNHAQKKRVSNDDSLIIRNGHTSPHFRRGHFRFLSSDRFKNKQGQSVFVKSTFVHGDAKTVQEAS